MKRYSVCRSLIRIIFSAEDSSVCSLVLIGSDTVVTSRRCGSISDLIKMTKAIRKIRIYRYDNKCSVKFNLLSL
jgi:hypothetical protein